MGSVQFIQYTPEQLQEEIAAAIKAQLEDFLKHFTPKPHNEYLTRQKVAEMLDIDLSTLYNWTKSGKLKAVGIGNRVYYLRSDVESALIPLR